MNAASHVLGWWCDEGFRHQCPRGTYNHFIDMNSDAACVTCPAESTTNGTASTSLGDCYCENGFVKSNGTHWYVPLPTYNLTVPNETHPNETIVVIRQMDWGPDDARLRLHGMGPGRALPEGWTYIGDEMGWTNNSQLPRFRSTDADGNAVAPIDHDFECICAAGMEREYSYELQV